MAVTALVIYAVWFLLAFGLRMLVQVRRTGSTGFKGLGGSPGSLEWTAGILFVVALVTGVAAPVAALAGLDPIGALDAGWVAVAGTVLALVGVAATLAAQLSMGASWRLGVDKTERTEFVVAGAFEIVRNPIYSAMLVTAVGLVLMVANVVSIVGLIGLVIALELQVRVVEEPYLAKVHGDAYRTYCRRVGRFLPAVGRST